MRRFWDVVAGVGWRSLKKVATNPQLLLPSLIFPLFFFVAFAGGLSSVGDVPGFDFPSGYTAFSSSSCFCRRRRSAACSPVRDRLGLRERLLATADAGLANRIGILFGYALSAMSGPWSSASSCSWSRSRPGCRSTATASTCSGWSCWRDRQLHGGDVVRRGGDAAAHDPGRAGDADAGVHHPVPGAGVRPAGPVAGWVEAVAHVNPFTAFVEGGRDFISGQAFDVWLMFALAIGLGAVFLAWAVRGVHRAEMAGV